MKRESQLRKTRRMKHSSVCMCVILATLSSISSRLGCFLDIRVKSPNKSKRELEQKNDK